MKRRTIIVTVILCLMGVAFAESGVFLQSHVFDDWYAMQSAEEAIIPEGLSEREAEIYRAGYATGHYNALHPAYIEGLYVLNTKTKKFHLSYCKATLTIDTENRKHSSSTPLELMMQGYKPCGQCNPEKEDDE